MLDKWLLYNVKYCFLTPFLLIMPIFLMVCNSVLDTHTCAEYVLEYMKQQNNIQYDKIIFSLFSDTLFMTLSGDFLSCCTLSMQGKKDKSGMYHMYIGITKIQCDSNSEGHGSYVVNELLRVLKEVSSSKNILLHRPLAITVLPEAQKFRKKNEFGFAESGSPDPFSGVKDIREYQGE